MEKKGDYRSSEEDRRRFGGMVRKPRRRREN